MSVTTNIFSDMARLFHSCGSNQAAANAVSALEDKVYEIRDQILVAHLPSITDGNAAAAAANGSITMTSPFDCKLIKAYLCTTPAITNATGDDVIVGINTNGVTACSYNSNASAQGAIAANSVLSFSDPSNGYVDTGEVIKIYYTMADNTNNYLNAKVVMQFRRQ